LDNPVEPPTGREYDRLESRVARVEGDVHDLKDILGELKVMVARIDAQIPYLATKAEIAGLESKFSEMPSKTYMWGILAALLTAYACGLAALAVLR
jgi:uncharacterized coiled-coil protein SlyX